MDGSHEEKRCQRDTGQNTESHIKGLNVPAGPFVCFPAHLLAPWPCCLLMGKPGGLRGGGHALFQGGVGAPR